MGAESQIFVGNRRIAASEREESAKALARRQHHLLTAAQAVELGYGRSLIQRRLVDGRWFAPHSGVYSLSPPPLTDDARIMAAVLACGEGSVASAFATAWLFALVPSAPTTIDIANSSGTGRTRSGIRVHQRMLDRCDLTIRKRIPSCTPTRAIVDLAEILTEHQLEDLLLQASSRRLIRSARLHELATRAGMRGGPLLRRILGLELTEVRSQTEGALLRICRSIGAEPPVVNGVISAGGRRFAADLHWPRLRMIVEVDGYAFHGGRSRANSDRDRDQVLTMAGWVVYRFTRDQIVSNPEEVRRRLAALLKARSGSFAGPHR